MKELYAKLQRNQYFEVAPSEVHFSGFEVSNKNKNEPPSQRKKYSQILRIINISDQVQRCVILPPQSKIFDIHYVKQVFFSCYYSLKKSVQISNLIRILNKPQFSP
jgi:hypothetical protein